MVFPSSVLWEWLTVFSPELLLSGQSPRRRKICSSCHREWEQEGFSVVTGGQQGAVSGVPHAGVEP